MKYIVNISGGLTSYEAYRRTIAKHGRANTIGVFADTRIEDEDLYRFLKDQECLFGVEIIRLQDGRTPFEVMHDERCITIQSAAPCSKILKRQVIERWIKENFQAGTYTRVYGMEWDEEHRMERLKQLHAPDPVWFPLAESPLIDKCQIARDLEAIGVAVPRLYNLGFTHNNCGGGCVKAGQAHWANLLSRMPERYAKWEQHERGMQAHLGKPVTILREVRRGVSHSLSLQAFRERLEQQPAMFDQEDWGGCGCFSPVAVLPESEVQHAD